MRGQGRRQGGAVSLELVLLTPIFLLLLDLAVLGGRLTESQSQVDDAAHAGARAASLQRTTAAATLAAQTAIAGMLDKAGAACVTPRTSVDLTGFRAGGTVAVSVDCNVSLGDLSWLPLPGTRQVAGRSVSAVDTYRSTTP